MALRPFIFTDTVVLTASATATVRLPVSNGEKGFYGKLYFVSTGAFNVTGLRSDNSISYSDASAENPLTSTTLQNAANANRSLEGFDLKLDLEGPNALNIDITDTSGSGNTVRISVVGEKEF